MRRLQELVDVFRRGATAACTKEVCVCVRERARERESVCICACVCVRESVCVRASIY